MACFKELYCVFGELSKTTNHIGIADLQAKMELMISQTIRSNPESAAKRIYQISVT